MCKYLVQKRDKKKSYRILLLPSCSDSNTQLLPWYGDFKKCSLTESFP